MAVDYFLKLDSIDGESTDNKHKGEIVLESFSWGIANALSPGGGGAGAGKASFTDFQFTTRVSKASPRLAQACASGEKIKFATLSLRRAGGEQSDFLTYKIEQVVVTSYQLTGSKPHPVSAEGDTGDPISEVALDQVRLGFAKVQFSYRPQRPDGTFDPPVTMSWDLGKGQKF
jgi:type VI secretion system secreted protein Hcp